MRRILKSLGLESNEIKIYLSCLTADYLGMSTISKKSGIGRTTLYGMMDKLCEKGFVTKHIKEGKQNYSAVDPEIILERLKQKNSEMTEHTVRLERLLPSLAMLKGKGINPVEIEYFDGYEGVISMINDTIVSKPESVKAIVLAKHITEEFKQHVKKHHVPKRKPHVSHQSKTIVVGGKDAEDYAYNVLTYDKGEVKVIPENKMNIKVSFQIYGGKIAVFFSGNRSKLGGVFIKNQDLHDTFNAIFDLIWSST